MVKVILGDDEREIDVATMFIGGKVSDMCSVTYRDAEGNLVAEQENGYVPGGLGVGHGDYLELEIDLQTGQILNWTPPTEQALYEALTDSDCRLNEELLGSPDES